jgi:hypothetical protein
LRFESNARQAREEAEMIGTMLQMPNGAPQDEAAEAEAA